MLWLMLSFGCDGHLSSVIVLLLFSLASLLATDKLFYVCEDAREAHIHAFDNIGQFNVVRAFLGLLLDVVAGAGVI